MWRGSGAYKVFEAGLVLDDYSGTFDLQELLLFEITKQPSHGLSRCPDHLGDFFVCEGECEPYITFVRPPRALTMECLGDVRSSYASPGSGERAVVAADAHRVGADWR